MTVTLQPDAIDVGPEFGPLLPPGEPEDPGAPSHPIIEENTMTVQSPSVPPIAPRIDDEEEPEIERKDDIPSDDNTPVDETSSSRDGWYRDIERE